MVSSDHRRRHEPCENERPAEVDFDDPRPFLKRGLREPRRVRVLALGRDPCIVHENRNRVPTFADATDETGRIILASHVDRVGDEPIFVPAEDIERPLHMLCRSRHKSDAAALGQKPAHDRKANAARSSGHKDDASVALLHLRLLISTRGRAWSNCRQRRDGRAHGTGKAQRGCGEQEVSALMLPHPVSEFGKVPELAKRDPDLEQAEFVKRQ